MAVDAVRGALRLRRGRVRARVSAGASMMVTMAGHR